MRDSRQSHPDLAVKIVSFVFLQRESFHHHHDEDCRHDGGDVHLTGVGGRQILVDGLRRGLQ